MSHLLATSAPTDEVVLLARCDRLAGLTLGQLALGLGLPIPEQALRRKGWIGQALELALGTTAGNLSLPDFVELGIELKTLPVGANGQPLESTYVCSIPLLSIGQQQWENSTCYQKLKRVLWLPVEGERDLPFMHRRLGQGFLWSPTPAQYEQLAADWQMLTDLIVMGHLESLDARQGVHLQVRPKAANGAALCAAYNAAGELIQTLPRGFYLRSSFTQSIFQC